MLTYKVKCGELCKMQNTGQSLKIKPYLGLSVVISNFGWANVATAGQLVNHSDMYLNEWMALIVNLVCVWEGEVSQMAPKGFSLIVASPGIRPLGLVASTAFDVTTKSNHLCHSGTWIQINKDKMSQQRNLSHIHRVDKITETLQSVRESRTSTARPIRHQNHLNNSNIAQHTLSTQK